MTGTVEHDRRIFSIRAMGGDRHVIVEMDEDRMPQGHAPMSHRMRVDAPNLHDDPLIAQGDASILRSVTVGMRPEPAPTLPSPGPEKSSPRWELPHLPRGNRRFTNFDSTEGDSMNDSGANMAERVMS
jgi:hypothetical protein